VEHGEATEPGVEDGDREASFARAHATAWWQRSRPGTGVPSAKPPDDARGAALGDDARVRVLVVTNMYPSQDRPALGAFVRDQVEALRSFEGLELELFSFEPTGVASYVKAAAALRRRYRDASFDVVHAQYGLSAWCALVLRAPRIVTFHGTDLEHGVVGPLSRAVVHRVTLPAPVSATLAREALPALIGRREVAVLPCGVNVDRFRPLDRIEARRALGLDPDGRYLLFPADPARREKRHDRALALAAELPDARLLTYAGAAFADVPLLVNAADVVVCTSEREGFGLAPLEALACDVPVLSTDVGVAPLALRGLDGALCGPFDLGTWVPAARRHLDAGGGRVAGRARAQLFEARRFAARVAMAYRDVVASDRSAPEGTGAPL
jgi:teichuronic acid biosynthesis glycosyltransferase TuaC